jgi:hypothetical protein
MVAQAEPVSVRRKTRKPGLSIPLFTRLRAQNLYVNQLASASVVGAACGLTPKQVYDLADREGWAKLRNETKRRATEDVNARTQANIDELVEHVASDTAELSLGTLAKAKRTLERDDEFAAKDLQAYSVAAKNFVGLYRQAKQLDVSAQSGDGATVNVMFVGALPKSAERIARNVTPAVAAQGQDGSALPASGQTLDVSTTQSSATPAT